MQLAPDLIGYSTSSYAILRMHPGDYQSTQPSNRGPVAVLIVAVCLSVAGLSAAYVLRQKHESEARNREQTAAPTKSLFTPELKALDLLSKVAEPRQPFWASAAKENASVPAVSATAPPSNTPAASAQAPFGTSAALAQVSPAPSASGVTIAIAAVGSAVAAVVAPQPSVSATALPQATASTTALPQATASTPATLASSAPPSRVKCGNNQCAPGLVCCNASCGTCARPGERCSQQVCGMPTAPASTPCGINTCNVGELCCNPYCGVCARSLAECNNTSCPSPIQYPQSVSCGMVTCNTGFVCCNPSCGVCAPYGEPCSQEPC
jgi:cytochrome c556